MKKLKPDQITTKKSTAEVMGVIANRIKQEIEQTNAFLAGARERIESLVEDYNNHVEDANAFLESIHEEQEAYMSERSESWSATGSGEAYQGWADEWQLSLEPIEVEVPEEVEGPSFDDLDIFRELPEAP